MNWDVAGSEVGGTMDRDVAGSEITWRTPILRHLLDSVVN